MKILFLTNMYPPHDVGGYEQICQEVAEGLKQCGHELKILTSRYGVGEGVAEGEVVRTLHLQTDLNYYKPADFFLKHAAHEQFNLNELARVVKDFQPDVAMVWGMWLLSHQLPRWLEEHLPGQVTYYLASYWPTDVDPHTAYWSLPARRWLTDLTKRPLRALAMSQLRRDGYPPRLQFERVLSCSDYVKTEMVKAGKVPASSGVLYIGIDPSPFENLPAKTKTRNTPLRMVYFGRLIEDKGVHTAVEAIGLLKQQGFANQIELTILGSGHPAYEAHLQNLITKYGIEAQVKFSGKIPRTEIPAFLAGFDVFLFTSIWHEPFGRTIVEAMLAGLVVIGSDVGGSREIFAEYDKDLLYPAGDASALAERVKLLLDGSKNQSQLIQHGRSLALKHFTLKTMIEGIEQYLQATVK